MAVELYPNQIFRFNSRTINDKDEHFCKILLASGHIAQVKLVEPIPVDATRTKLEGATTTRILESIEEVIESKYGLKKVKVPDEKLDEIEDIVAAKKLSKKEKRDTQEKMVKEAELAIKEEMKENDRKTFFNSLNVYQCNGIFLNKDGLNSGLLQLPSDTRFKARNVHLVKNDNPFVNFTIINSKTKEILKLSELEDLPEEDIKILSSFNALSTPQAFKDVFTINGYLLNKMMDSDMISSNKFDAYNLIRIDTNLDSISYLIPKDEDRKMAEEYASFITDEFTLPLRKVIRNYTKEELVMSLEDKNELERLYNLFLEVVVYGVENDFSTKYEKVLNWGKNYYGGIPSFVNVSISIFIQNDKKKDFVKYLVQDWKNTKDSFFNIIKNKDKVDYFALIDTMPLENIVGIIKIVREYDEDDNLTLHKIFTYPPVDGVKKATPRLMAYSVMDGTPVPNIVPPGNGKNRGFVPFIKVIK